jgi:hypothetical protein
MNHSPAGRLRAFERQRVEREQHVVVEVAINGPARVARRERGKHLQEAGDDHHQPNGGRDDELTPPVRNAWDAEDTHGPHPWMTTG